MSDIREKLMILLNLTESIQTLRHQIEEELLSDTKDADGVFHLLDSIIDGEITTIETIQSALQTFGYNKQSPMFDENPSRIPLIECYPHNNYKISVPFGNGRLAAYTAESDSSTKQVGLMFEDIDGYQYDLALAEVKNGELAKNNNLPEEGNKQIDLYLWEDERSEDYTYCTAIDSSVYTEECEKGKGYDDIFLYQHNGKTFSLVPVPERQMEDVPQEIEEER